MLREGLSAIALALGSLREEIDRSLRETPVVETQKARSDEGEPEGERGPTT